MRGYRDNINQFSISEVYVFAYAAHKAIRQKRKYTTQDYFVHPLEVSALLKPMGVFIEAGALLHDVVEDTGIEFSDIQTLFGEPLANLVYEVSKVSKKEDGNRAVRKQIDLKHFASGSAGAQTIKVADIYSNIKDIVDCDVEFAKKYLPENRALLEALTKAEPYYRDLAFRALVENEKKLEIFKLKGVLQ